MGMGLAGCFVAGLLGTFLVGNAVGQSEHAGHTMGQLEQMSIPDPVPLVDTPASGKARESGFDHTAFMEPFEERMDIDKRCAQGRRGLIHLERDEWRRCDSQKQGVPGYPGVSLPESGAHRY